MLNYEVTSSWHTAPATWLSFSYQTHSTHISSRAITAGGSPAGSTRRATSSTRIERLGVSTGSTSNAVVTALQTTTSSTAGTTAGSTSRTDADTSSSSTAPGGSASASFTRTTAALITSTSATSYPALSTVDTTTTRTATIAWPSTYTTDTTTGTEPLTGTTTTRVAASSWPGSRSETYTTITQGTQSYASTETYTTTGATSTTVRHEWLPLPSTIIVPDAVEGPLLNDAVAWTLTALTTESSVGLWTDFFSTLVSATAAGSVPPYTVRVIDRSTSWQSYSLSTETVTYVATTTGTTSTDTGTVNSVSGRSSLDGVLWDSTAEPESSTIWHGSITGSSTYTIPGPGTATDWTYTRQTSTYTDSSQWVTLSTTETWDGGVSFSFSYHTWQRSYTTSSTFSYPRSTSTGILVASYSTDGHLRGSISTTTEEWQTLNTTASWTEWDARTNAVLDGVFISTSATGSGANSTTEGHTSSVAQTWGRTEHTEQRHLPVVSYLSDYYAFTREARLWQRCMAHGFLGFGGGFSTGSPVHAGITSSVVAGTAQPGFSLVAGNLPRFLFHQGASIFATTPCWLEGHPFSSHVSATWLGTATGPRSTASLAHQWQSTGTTTSGTDTITTSTTISATYLVGVTGSISGTHFSQVDPVTNSHDHGIGRPASGLIGGAVGGLGPISSLAQTFSLPAGGVTLSWETAPQATSSSSTSTSSGEIVFTLPSGTSPIAWSYEPALVFSWIPGGEGFPGDTASVHHLPPYPWTADLDT